MFLVAMIAFGLAVVTLVQAVTVGMTANVIEGSARYLGGRYVVVARRDHGWAQNLIEDPVGVRRAIEGAGLKSSVVVQREVAGDNEPTLFFNGDSLRMRRISGVDFEAEKPVFSRLQFSAGGPDGLSGTKAILISRQVAERFGARLGDQMTLRLVNNAGYIDSAELVVKGIFSDASIFGFYNCYVDLSVLQKLMGDPPGTCDAMGFYLVGSSSSGAAARAMNAALARAGFQTFPTLKSRNDLESYRGANWHGIRYGVLPVEEYIDAKVMDLIRAIQLISYLLLGMILVIILVGMRNTTHIMIKRRTREIGTIRALGMTGVGATRLVLGESMLVTSLGFAIGLAAAVVVLVILQQLRFDWSDGFDIFLARGT